jgi:hypothetical protein
MTNHKANPPGWVDLDATDGEFTAKQFNTIDRGIAGGLDSRGGIVSPAQELRIDDFGTNKLLDSYSRGRFDRSAAGRFRRRLDMTTITDTGVTQFLDTESDIYWSSTVHTQTWNLALAISPGDGQAPITNDEIEVAITSIGFDVYIYSGSTLGPLILTFPAANSIQNANTPMYGKFRYNGTAWMVVDSSGDPY